MKSRWATTWDIPEAISFAFANAEKGNLDSRIYSYPTLKIMRTENGEGCAWAYLPVHSGVVLESLGWAPDLNAAEKTAAAIEALIAIEREAFLVGCREIFFVSSDERTDKFCQERLGYEKVSAMRKRLLL